MNNNPLVSIRTSCYNHEQYLPDYFQSIINQTYQHIELILFDDASPDDSQKVIKEWLPLLEQRFNRVIYIPREKNVGLIKNLNESNNYIQGEYIIGFASDDIMLPDFVHECVSFLESNQEFGMVYGDVYNLIHGKVSKKTRFNKNVPPSGNILKDLLLTGNFIPAPAVCVRHSVYQDVAPYDESKTVEDYQMWLAIAAKYNIAYLGKPVAVYRMHTNSLSHNPEKRLSFCEAGLNLKLQWVNYLPEDDRTLKNKIIVNAYKKTASVCFMYKNPPMFFVYYNKYLELAKEKKQKVSKLMIMKSLLINTTYLYTIYDYLVYRLYLKIK